MTRRAHISTHSGRAPSNIIDGSELGIETELGWSLNAVHAGYARTASTAVAGVPGGARGYQILVAATTEAPRSQLALGRRLGLDKNAMTALIDALEDAQLVRREPDPTNRRAHRVVVTNAGRSVLARARKALHAAEEELMDDLSTAERAQLRGLLARVALSSGAAPPCNA